MVDSGRPSAQFQNLLPKESLEEMGNELVSLCDGLEKYGLVDYQMGVSEQEIVESKPEITPIYCEGHENCRPDIQVVLTHCIDLVGNDDENDDEAGMDPMPGQSGPGFGKQ